MRIMLPLSFFFFQAEDGIRDGHVTGVQTCALPISPLDGSRVAWRAMDEWVARCSREIGRRAERELEALVAVSSPSGDRHGADECAAVCAALVPDDAALERVPCSSPDHALDMVARLEGSGSGRILLL